MTSKGFRNCLGYTVLANAITNSTEVYSLWKNYQWTKGSWSSVCDRLMWDEEGLIARVYCVQPAAICASAKPIVTADKHRHACKYYT